MSGKRWSLARRATHSAAMKARWADPRRRLRWVRGLEAGWAKRLEAEQRARADEAPEDGRR